MSKITVLKVIKTKAEKGYPIVELSYKTEEDKTKGMKIFGWGDQKEIAQVAGDAKQGDVLEAEFEQNNKGYWQFRTLKATGEKAAVKAETPSAGAPAPRGNWETAEERQARQVMIVRQSSLSTAAGMVQHGTKPGTKVDEDEVLKVASKLEAFVLGTKPVTKQTGDVE